MFTNREIMLQAQRGTAPAEGGAAGPTRRARRFPAKPALPERAATCAPSPPQRPRVTRDKGEAHARSGRGGGDAPALLSQYRP